MSSPQLLTTRQLIVERPAFRWFWAARTITNVGDQIGLVAFVQYIYERGGDGTAVGLLLMAYAVPRLLGPVSGALVDRLPTRPLLIATQLGEGLIVALVVIFTPSIPVLIVAVGGTGLLAITFAPAGRSAIPSLVGRPNLTKANAMLAFGVNGGLAAGPLIGGVLAATIGVRAALAIDVATYAVAVALLLALPSSFGRGADAPPPGRVVAEIGEGLRYAARQPAARAVLIGLVAGVLFAAISDPAFAFLAQDELGSDASGFGLLVAAWGIGMTAGTIALVRWSQALAPRSAILVGIGLMGVGILVAGGAPLLIVAAGALAVGGVGNAAHNIANDTLIGQTVPNRLLGRVFGSASTAAAAGATVAFLTGGLLVDTVGPRLTFAVAGVGALLAVLLVARLLPSPADLRTLQEEAEGLVRG